MRLGIICVILLVMGSPAVAHSLKETIDLAMRNSDTVRAAYRDVENYMLRVKAMEASWLPSLSLDSAWQHNSEAPAMTVLGNSLYLGREDVMDLSVTTQYVLYNGNARELSISLLDSQLNASQVNLDSQCRALAFEVSKLYKTVQSVTLTRAIIKTTAEKLENQLNRLSSQIRNGQLIPLERITLQLALSEYRQQLLDLDAQVITLTEHLTHLTKSSVTVAAPLQKSVSRAQDISLDTLVSDDAIDFAAHESIRALDTAQTIQEQNLALTQSKSAPSVALFGTFHHAKPGLNANANEWMDYSAAGLKLSWRFWDWNATAQEAEANRELVKKVQIQKEAQLSQLQRQLNQLRRECRTLLERLRLQQQSVQLAEEKMRLIQIQTKEGFLSARDSKDAYGEVTQAKLRVAQAELELGLKVIEIDYKTGKPVSEWRLEL